MVAMNRLNEAIERIDSSFQLTLAGKESVDELRSRTTGSRRKDSLKSKPKTSLSILKSQFW